MKKLIIILIDFCHLLVAEAQIKVSTNKPYLVKSDGSPYFWPGDTAGELFHRLNREQASYCLKRRPEKDFSVIQAVAFAEHNGLYVSNPYGDTPLLFDDPKQPNEAYFKQVDYLIDNVVENNMTTVFLPIRCYKIWKSTW